MKQCRYLQTARKKLLRSATAENLLKGGLNNVL